MKKKLYSLIIFSLFIATVFAQTRHKKFFKPIGKDQTWTVPAGVTQIKVKLWGAGGAGGNYVFNDIGGGGGFATGTLAVTPGETLTIIVGAGGLTGAGSGAYGGGGGKANGVGGRGGGRSAIINAIGTELITAGAGGGGGGVAQAYEVGGHGGGGLSGEPDNWLPYGGGAGTQTHAGVGGISGPENGNCSCGSNPGSGHNGGYAGLYDNGYHGSGGGGYYGGGSGTDLGDGAGGGGSSFVPEGGKTIAATSNIPGNTSDPDYRHPIGYGGNKGKPGQCGLVIIIYTEDSSITCPGLPYDLTKHLVAYYPFCSNANDESGNNNNPDFNNATLTTDRFGNANSAYSFNGNGQYIKGICSNYPKECRTISVWFNINDLSRHNEIMGYGGGSCGTSFFIILNETNHPNAYTASGHCEAHNCTTSNGYPPPAGWNNLIITSGRDGKTRFYLNGVLIDAFNTEFTGTGVAGKDFAFGSIPAPDGKAPYTDTNVEYLKGSLDDIVIYDWEFNSKQVKQLYDFFSTQTLSISTSNVNEASASPVAESLYPNPSKGNITVTHNSGATGKTQIKVYDLAGKMVFTKTGQAIKGNNTSQINLSNLKPGIYYLELNNGTLTRRIKFIIER